MGLTSGTRVGPYEIISPLGAGGMGEVYRARDAKLGRDVAIKILPDHFVADAERLARFEREARTLASLNHPNVAQIYGMEDLAPGGPARGAALIMELVDGDDLSVVLGRGAVPIPDALAIAQQVAQALEAAHEIGVIHRDLKPANIKVRPDGAVKVLDFGLAKAAAASGGVSGSLANSPTFTSAGTEMGTILGTAAYMSPEQARGKAVDRRADVWAFGVVLYEMLAGRRAFDGSEISDVLASVLKDSIAFDALPAETPPAIRRLLRRCLVKNRADRLDSMATARLEIADALGATGDDAAAHPAQTPPPAQARRRLLAASIAIVGVALGLAAGWALFRSPSAPVGGDVVRFSIALPPDARLTGVAIAGVGDTIVYAGDRLYTRRLSDDAPQPVPGTDGAENLFLSPDGRWAGYFAGGQIRKVALTGGDPLPIADAEADTPGAAWGPNNTVLFSGGWNAPLYAVSADGGAKPVVFSTLDTAAGEMGHWWPEFMPDGKTALITVWMAATGINDARLAALDLGSGKHRILMPGSSAKFFPPDRLLFFHAGAFHVVPFDPVALRATGEPTKVLPDAQVMDPLGDWTKPVAVSSAGTLVYLSRPLVPEMQLTWVSRRGVSEPVAGPPQRWRELRLSPDGRSVVGSRIEGGTTVLWVQDLGRETGQRLDLPGANFDAMWSPSGDALIFTSMRKGHFDAFRLALADGVPRPIIEEPYDQQPLDVAHDGKRFVLYDYLPDGTSTITAAEIERPTTRTRLQINASAVSAMRLSADDKWLAATVTSSGRPEIVVQAFPGPGAPVQITSRGGGAPTWSRSEPILYYQRDYEVVAAAFSTLGGRFTVGTEETLFRLPDHDLVGLAPDGRFLMTKKLPGQAQRVQVVVNWFRELAK